MDGFGLRCGGVGRGAGGPTPRLPLPVETAEEGVRFEKRKVGAAGAETVLRVADEELREQHPAGGGNVSGEVEVGVVGVEAEDLPRREVEVRRR